MVNSVEWWQILVTIALIGLIVDEIVSKICKTIVLKALEKKDCEQDAMD